MHNWNSVHGISYQKKQCQNFIIDFSIISVHIFWEYFPNLRNKYWHSFNSKRNSLRKMYGCFFSLIFIDVQFAFGKLDRVSIWISHWHKNSNAKSRSLTAEDSELNLWRAGRVECIFCILSVNNAGDFGGKSQKNIRKMCTNAPTTDIIYFGFKIRNIVNASNQSPAIAIAATGYW